MKYMTQEEAIRKLKNTINYQELGEDDIEALKIGVKALESDVKISKCIISEMLKNNPQKPVFKTTPQQALTKGRIRREVAKQYGRSLDIAKQKVLGQYHLVWLFALREEFGFADSRARRVLNKFIEINEDIGNGLITFDDLKEVIRDEIGEDFYNDFLRLDWEVRD